MKSWYSIKNTSAETAEISIYDEIGFYGISAASFLEELKSVGNRKIILRINSPGGDVFQGLPIYNRLKEHAAGVEVRIDGLAASMASVIAMAGSPVKIAENALIMIHNPAGFVAGDAADMREWADVLDKIRASLVTSYVRKTGKTEAAITKMMDAETWLNATEALDQGFVDEVTEPLQVAARFDMSKFRNAPTAPKPQPPQNKPSMTPLRTALITALSLTDPADKPLTDAQIMSSFVTALGDVQTIVAARDTAVTNLATMTGERDTQKTTIINLQSSLGTAQAGEKAAKDLHAALITALKTPLQLDDAQILALGTDAKPLTTAIETLADRKAIAIAASQGVPPLLKDWNKETGEKTMTVAAFNKLTHVSRNAYIAAGGKLTD